LESIWWIRLWDGLSDVVVVVVGAGEDDGSIINDEGAGGCRSCSIVTAMRLGAIISRIA